MLNGKKFLFIVEVLLVVLFHILQDGMLVKAYVRSGKVKASQLHSEGSNDHSSNDVSVGDDVRPKFVDEHHYYLPKQTVFGSSLITTMNGVSITSPPHLTINPAPIQTSRDQSTNSVQQNFYEENDDYIIPYLSHCVSETPSVNKLDSQFLLPSEDLLKESVVMSGHMEIASKTSSENEVSEAVNIVSAPSAALQGTRLYAHSVTDM